MVEISILAEGGVFNTNVEAATIDNSNALRQSLHEIFSKALERDDVSISVFMNAGRRSAAKAFRDSESKVFLYTDLDRSPENRADWFVQMRTENKNEPIIFSEEKAKLIFFMIQEMEAWILKQPNAVELWANKEGYKHFPNFGNVASHRLIAGKDIEHISDPSDKLSDIIKQTFQSNVLRKNGKPKGVSYGKLKNAPDILQYLDVSLLLIQDSELSRFKHTVLDVLGK